MSSSHVLDPTAPPASPGDSLDWLQIACATSMVLVALLTFCTVEHHGEAIIRWGRFLQAKTHLPRCLRVIASTNPGMFEEDLKMAVWGFFWIIWFEGWFFPFVFFQDEPKPWLLLFVGIGVPGFIFFVMWFYLASQRRSLEEDAWAAGRLEEGAADKIDEKRERGKGYTDTSPLLWSVIY